MLMQRIIVLQYFIFILLMPTFIQASAASAAAAAHQKSNTLDKQKGDKTSGIPTHTRRLSYLNRPKADEPVTNKLKKKQTEDAPNNGKYTGIALEAKELADIKMKIFKAQALALQLAKEDAEISLDKLIGKIAIHAMPATQGQPEVNLHKASQYGYNCSDTAILHRKTPVIVSKQDKRFYFGVIVGKTDGHYLVQTALNKVEKYPCLKVRFLKK